MSGVAPGKQLSVPGQLGAGHVATNAFGDTRTVAAKPTDSTETKQLLPPTAIAPMAGAGVANSLLATEGTRDDTEPQEVEKVEPDAESFVITEGVFLLAR